MAVVGQRTRIVYFRLSETEFGRLSALCRSVDGERSISELVRTAVLRLLANAGANDQELTVHVDRGFAEVSSRLDELRSLLERQGGQ